MAQIDLGKLKFQWKGLWTTSTAYEVDDVVHYDGTTYVVVTDVPATNTSEPGASASFEIMARGLNFRGAYNNTATYLHNEIVTSNSASWISTQSSPFTGQTPASGSSYWGLLTPAPASSVLTSPGDIVYRDNTNNTQRLPIGTLNSTIQVIEQPNNSIARTINYSVGTATPATAIATDADNTSSTFGTNAANGSITLSRGRSYVIVFPANGLTYSIKDPAAANYSTAGSNGRVTSGVTPDFVTNGGSFLFSPTSLTPNSVLVRNEASGTDELTINVVDMALVPSWSGAELRNGHGYRIANDFRNTLTESLLPIQQNKEFGRGSLFSSNPGLTAYRTTSVLGTDGASYSWGNFYDNGTQGYTYGSQSVGWSVNGTTFRAQPSYMRTPVFFQKAVAGNAADAKFLTDLNGNSLDYTTHCKPKIIHLWRSMQHHLVLTENGMILKGGYGGFGRNGEGATATYNYALLYIQPYDESTTILEGTARPKFKQTVLSNTAYSGVNYSLYGLSTDGEVFAMGDNGSGQLGNGTSTDNFYFKRIDPAQFNNEQVIFIHAYNGDNASVFAITETGKCFAWGNNAVGQLGLGNTTNQTTPQEVTAVTGSPIENKVITHICSNNQGANTYAHTYFLTSEGKVYASGDAEVYGAYLGVYRSGQTNVTRPILLTDSATGCNSDNQKVVSMWCSQYRYNCLWLITDGGDSGLVRMYATGSNGSSQQGSAATTTSGISASAQGTWFMNECVYRTNWPGSTTDNKIRADVGTLLKVGDPCIVYSGGNTTLAGEGYAFMLDSLGQLWISGRWHTHNPLAYWNFDSQNDFEGTNQYTQGWYQVYNQPEPMVSCGFGEIDKASENWYCVGKSGTVYGGGYDGWNANRGITGVNFNPFLLTGA